ncbi:MAG: hypothetical protein JWQ45_192 [Blastococcus sp.]|jgi:hypothetical protein|nr:hypothetical protein [Blastococcus sp.]
MGQPDTPTSLPDRVRPPQVLLGVGAVLLVTAGAAVAAAYGGIATRLLLVALAVTATGFSLRASWTGLRASEETLAASAAGLALAGSSLGGPVLDGEPVTAGLLAAGFLVLHRVRPSTAAWPLVAWGALQLAVLRAVDLVSGALHTEVYLCVALLGLGIALWGRRVVARLALITTTPWWLAGVVGGITSTWADDGGRQWFSAALMLAAAFGLLLARLREVLDPMLGPPRVIPVVAGIVAGTALTGACSSLGPLAMTLTGYAGVLLATLPAVWLEGWGRGLLLPVAVAAGVVMTGLCVVQLVLDQRWAELSLLLLLTAVPTALVAAWRAEDRSVVLPTTVGCLTGSILLALPEDLLTPVSAALLLTTVYGLAMGVGAELEAPSRRGTAVSAGVCVAAVVLLLVVEGERTVLAVLLLVQGLCTLGWAGLVGRRPDADPPPPPVAGPDADAAAEEEPPVPAAWGVGAGQLVAAGWIGAATAGLGAVECYSLPAAAGLLIAAGPRLVQGRSWPAWGPGLLVAATPSTVLAAIGADDARTVGVLVAAAVAMVAGARACLRAPLMIGAGTALAVAVGLAVRQLPWPLATALLVGSALIAVGMLRERYPVAGFGARLAELR